MLYMVQLDFDRNQRENLLGYFQERGLTHYEEAVVLKGAWVSVKEGKAYVLVQSKDVAEVEKACARLTQFAKINFCSVFDVQQL